MSRRTHTDCELCGAAFRVAPNQWRYCSIECRFLAKVEVNGSGCWLWGGPLSDDGYGKFALNGKSYGAHRASYQIYNGCPVPDGMQIDRLSAQRSRQTHCKRGHAFTEENTYRWRTARICRACARLRGQSRRQKRANLSEASR